MNMDIMPSVAPLPNPLKDEVTHDGKARHSVYDAGNGYQLSVISGWGSYTDVHGRYECAVLHDGDIVYDTPLAEDIIGYCDVAKVQQLLDALREL